MTPLLVGALAILAGIAPILAALGIPPFGGGEAHAPVWIGLVAGAVFVLAGLCIWAQAVPRLRLPASLLGLCTVLGLAVVAHWVAFGPGVRACTATLPFAVRAVPDLECRAIFGWGTLVVDALVLFLLGRLLEAAFGPRKLQRRIEALARGLLLVAVAPFVVLVAAWGLLCALGERLRQALVPGRRKPPV